ncbi:MAG: chloride channel protein [Planctomycetota bacterium]
MAHRQAPTSPRESLLAFLRGESTGLLLLCAVVGLMGGVGAVFFRWLIQLCQWLFFGHKGGAIAAGAPGWRLLLAPAIGGLLVGPIVARWAETRGHGVPELMRVLQFGRGVIRGTVGLVKTFASALTIGSGGSCGREGPIAQIGAAFASALGQRAGVSPKKLKILVGAGAAAGIAATFNAPIAGAFFALEVLLGNFAMECFAPIVVATVAGTLLSRVALGSAPSIALEGSLHELKHPGELIAYVALGVSAAVVSVVFSRALVACEEGAERLPLPIWLRPALGGIAVGAIAMLGLPEVMGNGAHVMEKLLGPAEARTTALFLLALLVGKLVATCLTLGGGGSGGVFSPSLFLGATLGALVGHLAGALLPFPTAEPGAYALVGMAAVAAGTTHAPITMMIMVFELTNDYKIIVPLMVSTSIAAVIARRISPESIYTLKLARKGVRLNASLEHMVMHHLSVEDVMRSHEAEVVTPQTPFPEVLARFLKARIEQLYVVDQEGRYQGVILLQDVKCELNANRLAPGTLVIAEDVAHRETPSLTQRQPLTQALASLQRSGLHELPVISEGEGRFLGTLSEHDLLGAYDQEVLRQDVLLTRFVSRSHDEPDEEAAVHTDYFELPDGFGLAQVPLPAALADRTLAGLEVRKTYGLNVLAIKVRDAEGEWVKQIPEPQRTLQAGDLLIVMGPLGGIEALRQGGSAPTPGPAPEAGQEAAERAEAPVPAASEGGASEG